MKIASTLAQTSSRCSRGMATSAPAMSLRTVSAAIETGFQRMMGSSQAGTVAVFTNALLPVSSILLGYEAAEHVVEIGFTEGEGLHGDASLLHGHDHLGDPVLRCRDVDGGIVVDGER